MTLAKILLVEDEAILALGLKNKLESLGYEVLGIASSGEEAIEMAIKYKPSLILMDVVLSREIDGIAAVEKIHETIDVPVIYLSAYSDVETVKRAKVTEPFGYLIKPFDTRELQIAIDLALYRHEIEELKESQHWLQTVLKSIGDAVLTTDLEGRLTFMNAAAERLLASSNAQTVGSKWREVFCIVDEWTRIPCTGLVDQTLKSGAPISSKSDYILISPDGREIPVSFSASPLMNGRRTMMGVVLILKDMSAERTREVEIKLRTVAMESSINAICIVDLEGDIKFANENFCKLWGYRREDVVGKQTSEICLMESADPDIEGVSAKNGGWKGDAKAIGKSGNEFYVRVSTTCIKDRFNMPHFNVYSFLNITDFIKAKRDLSKYLIKLHRTDLKIEEITEELCRNIVEANDLWKKTYDLLRKNSNMEMNEGLEKINLAITRSRSLIDEFVQFTLPISLYASLVELYQMKIDDFSKSCQTLRSGQEEK